MNGGTQGRALFVAHQATRTGAPIVLLHFLRWLRRTGALDFEVLLLRGGPLVPKFAEVAPVGVLRPRDEAMDMHTLETGLEQLGHVGLATAVRTARYRRALRRRRPFNVLYLNSADAWRMVRAVRGRRCAVIGHAHELETGLHRSFPRDGPWEPLTRSMDLLVAASDAVQTTLLDHGVPPERVHRHYEFVDTSAIRSSPERVADLRVRLGLTPDCLVVGGAGTVEWRKGPDLFVQLALAVMRRRPDLPVQFVWVGGPNEGKDFLSTEHELREGRVGSRVQFVGEQEDVAPWLELFDVLALTSREDPFPLVCLEASWLGTPVVCFDAGGMPEFLRDDDRGVVVPYLDVDQMAESVIGLLLAPAKAHAMAKRASTAVRARHDVEVVAPALLTSIEQARVRAGSRP